MLQLYTWAVANGSSRKCLYAYLILSTREHKNHTVPRVLPRVSPHLPRQRGNNWVVHGHGGYVDQAPFIGAASRDPVDREAPMDRGEIGRISEVVAVVVVVVASPSGWGARIAKAVFTPEEIHSRGSGPH